MHRMWDEVAKTFRTVQWLPAVTLLVAMLCGPAWALPEGEGWHQIETANFTLYSNLPEGPSKEIVLDLERLRSVLEQIFPDASFDAPVPTQLYVFADRESFAPYALSGDEPGFFAPHIHANFAVVVGSDADEAIPVVYRQYMHDLIGHNVPQLPIWFRHGLAEIFSTFQSDATSAVVGLPIEDSVGLVAARAMSVEEALAAETLPAGAENAQSFISTSWGLVHYLLVDDRERNRKTRAFVRSLDEDPLASASITDALGVSVAELRQALDEYLAQDSFPTGRFEIPASLALETRVEALTPAEVLVLLGDLLIHTSPDREAEALAHFDRALELDPTSDLALAGMGYRSQLAGDLDVAVDYYRKALAKRPDASRLQFMYGDCELERLGKRRPQDAEEEERLHHAIEAFRKCTELQPEYGEAWARLGYAYNLEARPAQLAIPALERAHEMLPGRTDVAYNLLLGYARGGKRSEASDLVETMEVMGADDSTLARSRQVVLQLDFQYAGRLAKEKRYTEAVALFAKVESESDNAALRQRAAEARATLEPLLKGQS